IGRRDPATWTVVVFLFFALIVWVGFTHLLGRFFVLAMPVAALAVSTVKWRGRTAFAAAGVGALTAVVVSWTLLHPRLTRFTDLAQNGLYGLDDLSFFVPPELADMQRPGTTVSLIGDAEGFLYRAPPGGLHYRTVFDLPGDATDMYQAWLGVAESEAHGLIVINPMEVERLSATYYHVPGLPKDFTGPRDRPFVIRK
ncbi:MAG TPA: hypothetical protein VH475_22885, partial [Tepidisphaeraceae bacterium]